MNPASFEHKKATNASRTGSTRLHHLSMVLALLALLATAATAHTLAQQKQALTRIENERIRARQNQQQVNQDLKTGQFAQAALKELEGWSQWPSATYLLEHFTRLPADLKLNHFALDRPFLLRPLPEEQQTAFLKYSLALSGQLSVELADAGTGEGKYCFPRFFDETNTKLAAQFSQDVPLAGGDEPDRIFDQWMLNASLDLQHLWSQR